MSEKKIPLRSELKQEETWDLTKIFENEAAFEDGMKQMEVLTDEVANYQGRLSEGAKPLLECLELLDRLNQAQGKVGLYASMLFHTETSNSEHAGRLAKVYQLTSKLWAKLSFVEPELMQLNMEQVKKWIEEEPRLGVYEHMLEDSLQMKAHTLSTEEERLLARLSPVTHAPSAISSKLRDADFSFDAVETEDGASYVVSEGRYGVFMEHKDRKLRERAYKSLITEYHRYRNTLAETLSSSMNYDNIQAELRGFKSARQAALYRNNIPESVYDQLVHVVNDHLGLMHRYVSLRKKCLGYDQLHYYDLMVPIIGDTPEWHLSFDEARDIVYEALKPLGPNYRKMLERAFNERWIDIPENQGKRTGAYSSGRQGLPAYILLNWNGTLDALFTLIHELGHSMHSLHTWENQPPCYANYGIFLAEIASTTNEILLTHYLLERYQDDEVMQNYILNHYLDGVRGTVYRQTMFAEFEQKAHEALQQGQPLTADAMDQIYGDLTYRYFGEDLEKDPEPSWEWARIPHFYNNFYVYQYATGFSAATLFSEQIIKEGQSAVDRYLAFLSAGNSDWPIDVLKKAGVDMTKPDATLAVFKRFDDYLTRLEKTLGGKK